LPGQTIFYQGIHHLKKRCCALTAIFVWTGVPGMSILGLRFRCSEQPEEG
jgi:hypothetical protein